MGEIVQARAPARERMTPAERRDFEAIAAIVAF